MRENRGGMACKPAGDYGATPQTGTKLRDTYKVIEGKPVRLTINVGNAQISGIPDVHLNTDKKNSCKSDNPFVWIIGSPDMHGKTLHCRTYLSRTPGISPSKTLSITYTLEGWDSPKQWISQVNVDDVADFPVLFKADIYLHTD